MLFGNIVDAGADFLGVENLESRLRKKGEIGSNRAGDSVREFAAKVKALDPRAFAEEAIGRGEKNLEGMDKAKKFRSKNYEMLEAQVANLTAQKAELESNPADYFMKRFGLSLQETVGAQLTERTTARKAEIDKYLTQAQAGIVVEQEKVKEAMAYAAEQAKVMGANFGELKDRFEIAPEVREHAAKIEKAFMEGGSATQKFANAMRDIQIAATKVQVKLPEAADDIFGLNLPLSGSPLLSKQQAAFGRFEAYKALRDSVKGRMGEPTLPPAVLAGTHEAQDIINRSTQQTATWQEDVLAVLQAAKDAQIEEKNLMQQVVDQLKKAQDSGMLEEEI